MKLIIAFLSAILVGFLTTVSIYLGVFKSVEIVESDLPTKHLVYKMHIGPYHKVMNTFKDVEKWAKDSGVDCSESFGEYLNDPKKVDEDHLRSHIGCVVAQPLSDLPEGYEQKTVSYTKVIKATFDGSPAVGPIKVYPKLMEYLEEKKLTPVNPPYEFYLTKGDDVVTTYYFPLEN